MFKYLFFAMALMCAACFSPKIPVADGRTVMTKAQYDAMLAELKEEMQGVEKAVATGNADEAQIVQGSFERGALYYQKRDFPAAAAEFEQVVKSNDKNSKAWYMLGSCYEHNGELASAQTAFKRSYELMLEQGYIAEIKR